MPRRRTTGPRSNRLLSKAVSRHASPARAIPGQGQSTPTGKQPARVEIRVEGLFPWQEEVLKCPARYIVMDCSRQIGKSSVCDVIAAYSGAQGQNVLWATPVAAQGNPAWETIKQLSAQFGAYMRESPDRYIDYPSGGHVDFVTTKTPDNLRSGTYDLAILDECAFHASDGIWDKAIRPMLVVRNGRALFPSTPKGRGNWFYELFRRGESADWPGW